MITKLIEAYNNIFLIKMKPNKNYISLKEEHDKFIKLLEFRGINDGVSNIANELFEVLTNTEPIRYTNVELYYNLKNYKIQSDNDFLSEITVNVLLSSGYGDDYGEFQNPSNNERLLDGNGRLINCSISLRVYNATKLEYNQIISLLYHELTHMYRFHQIMISDNENRINSENERRQSYSFAINLAYQNLPAAKLFSSVYYLLDADEINAKAAEVYPFIKSRKIDRNNIGKYFYDLLGVKIVNALTKFHDKILQSTDKEKEYMGYLYLYTKNLDKKDKTITPMKAFKMFLNNIKYSANRYQNQIMKIAERAIMEVEEENKTKYEHIGYDIAKILNEIRNYGKENSDIN